MPMLVCKGCGGPVSSQAAACPKCGQPPPIAAFSNSCLGTGIGMIGVLVVLAVIALAMKSCGMLGP